MPSVGIYIPDNSELEKKINLRAKKYHDGKVSAYVRKCVEKDLEGASEISPNTSLIDLARQFRPALAPRLERYNLQEQSLILDRLLEAFAIALERPNFSANKPFAITNSLEDIANHFRIAGGEITSPAGRRATNGVTVSGHKVLHQ